MSLQDLGSLGELIAAIATVATLFCLALQILRNMLGLQFVRDWWATGDQPHTAAFRALVDEELRKASG